MGGRDEIGDFYIEELEELQIENTPAPAPTADDRRRIAAQLAAKAKAAVDREVTRPKSAMEIIQEALQAEEAEKEMALDEKRRVAAEARAKVEAAQRRAATEAREAEEAARRAEEDRRAMDALAHRRTPRPPRDLVPKGGVAAGRPEHTDPMGRMATEARVAGLLASAGEGVEIVDLFVDIPPAVVGPLWHAHHVRAQHDGDLATAWAVQRVRDIVASRPSDVVAARVQYGDRTFAVWFDLDDELVLAMLEPAEVYLVGLSG